MPGIYSGRSRSPADQIATANQQLDRLATGEIENFRRRRPPPSPESQGTCVPIDEWYVRLGCGWRWGLFSALLMVGAIQSPVACGWSGPESTRTGASPGPTTYHIPVGASHMEDNQRNRSRRST